MNQLFSVTLGINYAAHDTGRRITLCVCESNALSAAIKAEYEADRNLDHPDVEYTHALHSVPVNRLMSTASMPQALAA